MAETAAVASQKPVTQMTLKELHQHVYGDKYPFDRRRAPMFERSDAHLVENEVNDDPNARNKIFRKHYKFKGGRMSVPATWTIEIDGHVLPVISRKNKMAPPIINNVASGKQEYNYETIALFPHARGYRYDKPYFICADEERYYALMLSPLCHERAEALGYRSGQEIIRLYDPNAAVKARTEKLKKKGRATLRLNKLFDENPSSAYAIAHMYGINVKEGTVDYEPEILKEVIADTFTLDAHRPPVQINVDTFVQDSESDKFHLNLLVEMAIKKAVIRFERTTWYYLVRGGGGIANKTPIGAHIPSIHGNDIRRPLLEYLAAPENSTVLSSIQKDADYNLGGSVRMRSNLDVLMAPMQEKQDRIKAEAEEVAELRATLTRILKERGDNYQGIHKMGLEKLRNMARFEGLEGYVPEEKE